MQVSAVTEADKAALQQATSTCRAQVKEQARFQAMSWYAQHRTVKNCIEETLTKG
jgi:hypothetical protein